MDKVEEDVFNGIRGGQGRSASEIEDSARIWVVMVLISLACMLVLMGCSPSARPTAKNDGEPPDRPNWEELRQQIGGL
jgi:hypothetical protein